jgi:hypothetical protein
MVVVNGPLTPVTIPLNIPIVATPGLLLLHVPPGVLVSVVVVPTQTVATPEIAVGAVLTVTTAVRIQPEAIV